MSFFFSYGFIKKSVKDAFPPAQYNNNNMLHSVCGMIFEKAWDESYLTYEMSFEQISSTSVSHLLPLMDVADESRQAEQSQQAQDFGEAENAQRPSCPVDLGVETVHHQEDVVHRDGRHKVHQEPVFQVVLSDRSELEERGRRGVTFVFWQLSIGEVIPKFLPA